MSQTYLTTDGLSERIHYDARTIREPISIPAAFGWVNSSLLCLRFAMASSIILIGMQCRFGYVVVFTLSNGMSVATDSPMSPT